MPLTFEERRRQTTSKLAALMLSNAFIFQEQLSSHEERVKPIGTIFAERNFILATAEHWSMIIDEINYVPIFKVARDILRTLPATRDTERAVRRLAQKSLEIVSKKAALRHDLMGRIYHLLLLEAKYLGTYYTSVPAATLLLKLCLDFEKWREICWTNPSSLGGLKIADLACGTGTLLMAASQAITDNYIKFSVAENNRVQDSDLSNLHKLIVEQVLHGYDVLPSAVHLTASTLALLAPNTSFRKMRLYSLPMGRMQSGQLYLGSIDYVSESTIRTQLDLMSPGAELEGAEQVSGEAARSVAPLPELDLCVMNPPFVRSVGGNLLFGSLPKDRSEMQAELSRRVRSSRLPASTTAGLGSVFTAIGDRHVKEGGRLALVLPAAVLTGAAWQKTRALIESSYVLEVVVVSHDAARWNFSENTDLSEAMFVARKRRAHETAASIADEPTQFINLWRNPATTADALSVADAALTGAAAPVEKGRKPFHGITSLEVGTTKFGEALELPWSDVSSNPWIGGAFAQSDLVRTAWHLRKGRLSVPASKAFFDVPIDRFDKFAILGPDRRDVYDGFDPVRHVTAYPALWGHGAEEMVNLEVKPNKYLAPLSAARSGRPLRDAATLASRGGRLMLAERLWLVTQKCVCVRMPQPGLSNVWWPVHLKRPDEAAEKVLALWLNSTLGILTILAHRVPTRGPWVQFKKPSLNEMPVLHIYSLSAAQRKQLAAAYDAISDQSLAPFPAMGSDPIRVAIDAAIAKILGLPDFSRVRDLLGQEPIVTGQSLGTDRPAKPSDEPVQFELF